MLLGFRSDPLRDCRSTRKQHSLLYEQITAGALWLRDRLRQPLQTESKMFLPSSCRESGKGGSQRLARGRAHLMASRFLDFYVPLLLERASLPTCFAIGPRHAPLFASSHYLARTDIPLEKKGRGAPQKRKKVPKRAFYVSAWAFVGGIVRVA